MEKPLYGAPCNGCGVCCRAVPCVFARDLIGAREGPCQALEFDGSRYWCGLLRNAHRHIYGLHEKPWADQMIADLMRQSGAFDVGCDSEDRP